MKLVILNRDGTLNQLGEDFLTSPEDWIPEPGALEAVAKLNHAGWHVAVATNQPGLGRGLLDAVTLHAIHAKMHKLLAAVGGRVDAVFYCPHTPEDECSCRKPAAGLLVQITDRFGVEPTQVHVVGSSVSMLQAGAAIGASLHLVCTGKAASIVPGQVLPPGYPQGTKVYADLNAFADALLTMDVAPAPHAQQAKPAAESEVVPAILSVPVAPAPTSGASQAG